MHDDRRRAESFGAAAARYDRSRPSYPEELLDAVLGPAPAELNVLDVGCGTGIAARQMAGRGARVLGVEPDPRMADYARGRGTEVEVGRIEEWDAAGRTFDRVTAAQAWHWVEPVRGAAKAAEVLRPGGRLCVFWNLGQPPAAVMAKLADVYRRLAPRTESYSVLLGYGTSDEYRHVREAIADHPDLDGPADQRFKWSHVYTTEAWLEQLPTHSDHAAMPADRLERVLDAVGQVIDSEGGAFAMEYTTLLIASTRR